MNKLQRKGQAALLKLFVFIIVVPIGFILMTSITTYMDWGYTIPFWGDPNVYLWVTFIVLVVAFGWSLAKSEGV